MKEKVDIAVNNVTLSTYVQATALKNGMSYNVVFELAYKRKTKELIDFVLKILGSKEIIDKFTRITSTEESFWIETNDGDFINLDFRDTSISVYVCSSDVNADDKYSKLRKILKEKLQKDMIDIVSVKMTCFVTLDTSTTFIINLMKDYNKCISLKNYTIETSKGLVELENQLETEKYMGRIILLEGPPGTGKTYYIKRLITKLFAEEKFHKILYYLGDGIKNLDISNCLKKNILIFEDTDQLLDISSGKGSDLSKILNLASGFVSVQSLFIFTANTPIKDINKAFTRDGRMIARIHFNEFKAEDAKEWLKQNSIEKNYDEQFAIDYGCLYSLADLYSKLMAVQKINSCGSRNIGFNCEITKPETIEEAPLDRPEEEK